MQDKIIKLVTLGLILILGFVSYRVFIIPKAQGVRLLRQTIKKVDQQIASLFGEEVVLKGGLEQQEALMKQLEELASKVPSERDLPRIMDEVITQATKGLDIDFKFIEPQEVIPKGNYKKFPLKVVLVSSYFDFLAYLSQLSQISATVDIGNLSMKKGTDNPQMLETELTMYLFVLPAEAGEPQGKAQALAPTFQVDPFNRTQTSLGLKEILGEEKKESEPAVRLQGIWKGREVRAFINNKIVKAGEAFEDYQVESIGAKDVVLTKGGKRYTLKLK